MLKNLYFQGFDIISSQFTDNSTEDEGYMKAQISEAEYGSDKDDDDDCWVSAHYKVIFTGYTGKRNDDESNSQIAFEMKLALECHFRYNSDTPMTKDELESSSWYLDNFGYIAIKLAAEPILKNSGYREIDIPWSGRRK